MANNKNDIPDLNMDRANEMLSQILEECNIEPNTISLEELVEYGNYRKEKYIFQRIGVVVIILLFAILPFFFISPGFTLEQDTEDPNVYKIEISSVIPTAYVTASIDGHFVPVSQTGDNVYTIEPVCNGEMTISVGSKNGQSRSENVMVTTVDNLAPTVSSSSYEGENFVIFVEDDMCGVDYDGIYMETSAGSVILPVSYDAETGEVDFVYPSESVNLYIPDMQGNTLHVLLTVQE